MSRWAPFSIDELQEEIERETSTIVSSQSALIRTDSIIRELETSRTQLEASYRRLDEETERGKWMREVLGKKLGRYYSLGRRRRREAAEILVEFGRMPSFRAEAERLQKLSHRHFHTWGRTMAEIRRNHEAQRSLSAGKGAITRSRRPIEQQIATYRQEIERTRDLIAGEQADIAEKQKELERKREKQWKVVEYTCYFQIYLTDQKMHKRRNFQMTARITIPQGANPDEFLEIVKRKFEDFFDEKMGPGASSRFNFTWGTREIVEEQKATFEETAEIIILDKQRLSQGPWPGTISFRREELGAKKGEETD